MALSATVTKKSVSLLAEGRYQITLNMQYLDAPEGREQGDDGEGSILI